MIKCENGIVTIGFDEAHIVLRNVVTVSRTYSPSMYSDGSHELQINGVTVYSKTDRDKIKKMISFIKARLGELE